MQACAHELGDPRRPAPGFPSPPAPCGPSSRGLPLLAILVAIPWPFDRNRRIAGRFLRLLAAFATWTFPYWRIRIDGKWPADRRAYVVVSNHQSMLDIFMLSRVPREMKWVAKAEGFSIPWIGWVVRVP